VGIPAGTPKPDFASAEGIKRFLLGAKSIAYPAAARGAACGVSFEATMAKLGIADVMAPKVKNSQSGWEAITMLARGEVDIGVTFASEMDADPRVEMLGAMPLDLSTPTGFVAFVNAQSKEPDAAQALIKFLSSPEAAKVFTDCGMKPGK
jgi:molybdate transport system substrate-binding protein